MLSPSGSIFSAEVRGVGCEPAAGREISSRLVWAGAVLLWLCVIVCAMGALAASTSTPGANAEAPARWPAASTIRTTPERATLVMFAHPHCPCTRASIHELARLQARLPEQLLINVLFMSPPDGDEDWQQTDLQRSARAIPGAIVSTDRGGLEAERFGVRTSGQTLVYGPDGSLLFRGGITPSRGHEGDSAGRAYIVAQLTKAQSAGADSYVYGCSLIDADRQQGN